MVEVRWREKKSQNSLGRKRPTLICFTWDPDQHGARATLDEHRYVRSMWHVKISTCCVLAG